MTVTECMLCHTEIIEGEPRIVATFALSPDEDVVVRVAHKECATRSVVGGIGHLIDHDFWCKVVQDSDGGLSYRQSALKVAGWIREHGMPPPSAEREPLRWEPEP